jgi:hypothetical protein
MVKKRGNIFGDEKWIYSTNAKDTWHFFILFVLFSCWMTSRNKKISHGPGIFQASNLIILRLYSRIQSNKFRTGATPNYSLTNGNK